MENESSKSCESCGPWWRLPLLLGLVLSLIVMSRFAAIREGESQSDDNTAAKSADTDSQHAVSLSIDFGSGRRQDFEGLAWHEGMTVADLLSKASGIEVAQKGAGQSAFLTGIDDISNEGADGRNWTYAVNGQSGDRSFAVYELQAGDHVLWKFGPRP